jgi:Tfp pilus assembly protein PilN
MRRLIVLSLLATLALAAPASAQLTHIRPGVTAGGVDLSGLAVPDAAAKLNA